uniref:BTB domain-containing protein n=1 Tax=Panagrolaimus sp. PS1159 TaxID=55785 RepID=A0AC35FFU0_9BILA
MLSKRIIVKKVALHDGQTNVKLNENIQFTINSDWSPWYDPVYSIEDVKGDFEILKLVYYNYSKHTNVTVPFDNDTMSFYPKYGQRLHTFDIHILADFQTVVSVTHRLQIPKARFQYLEPNQMFIDNFVLSNSTKNVAFKYYGKKIDEENVEIEIENPVSLGIKLNGQKCNLHYASHLQDIDLMLSIIFELPQEQTPELCESRPASLPTNDESLSLNDDIVDCEQNKQDENVFTFTPAPNSVSEPPEIECPKNKEFDDMMLITSDKKPIPFHHSFLSKHSTKFAKLFYDAKSLPEIGLPKLQNMIDPSNVCEFIEMAFKKNFKATKNFCKKYILENKSKINSATLGKMPQEILSFIFCY